MMRCERVFPKVSVVIPVYNVEQYIDVCLKSVFAQTFTDFEIIIVDDESPDSSIEKIRQYSDPRIKIVSQRNRGLAGARNTGIRHAKGQYIALLDADDLWRPEKLKRHVDHLDANPGLGISYSASEFMDEMGDSLHLYQKPKLHGITAAHVYCRNPIGNGSAAVIRATMLSELGIKHIVDDKVECIDGASVNGSDPLVSNEGGDEHIEMHYFDENLRQSEDIEFWVRAALDSSWQFEGLGEALTLYRVNQGGLSANLEKQFANWQVIEKKHAARHGDFFEKWEPVARSYQYRYLARRAIQSRDRRQAFKMLKKSFQSSLHPLTHEWRRTVLTCGSSLLLNTLPLAWYDRIESFAMKKSL